MFAKTCSKHFRGFVEFIGGLMESIVLPEVRTMSKIPVLQRLEVPLERHHGSDQAMGVPNRNRQYKKDVSSECQIHPGLYARQIAQYDGLHFLGGIGHLDNKAEELAKVHINDGCDHASEEEGKQDTVGAYPRLEKRLQKKIGKPSFQEFVAIKTHVESPSGADLENERELTDHTFLDWEA